jgi:hypothetical protein
MRWTQWPTSAAGSGIPSLFSPRLIGCHVAPPSSVRIQQDRVQAHSAGAGLPRRSRAVPPQPVQLVPRRTAVRRAKQRRVLDAGVHRVGIVQRRLEVPDPLEFPRVRRPVVPLMRSGHALIVERVPDRRPRRAAVVGALDHLPEPTTALGCVDAVRIGRGSLDVVHLPACEVRARDVPALAFFIRRQHERTLARADQQAYCGHAVSFTAAGPKS